MLETLRRRWFSLIHLKNLVYNQCWEDPARDHEALDLAPTTASWPSPAPAATCSIMR